MRKQKAFREIYFFQSKRGKARGAKKFFFFWAKNQFRTQNKDFLFLFCCFFLKFLLEKKIFPSKSFLHFCFVFGLFQKKCKCIVKIKEGNNDLMYERDRFKNSGNPIRLFWYLFVNLSLKIFYVFSFFLTATPSFAFFGRPGISQIHGWGSNWFRYFLVWVISFHFFNFVVLCNL